MSDPDEKAADAPDGDEDLRLAPDDGIPIPPPARERSEDEEPREDTIILIPVDEEPSREIPALTPLPPEPGRDLPPIFPTPVSPFDEPPEAPLEETGEQERPAWEESPPTDAPSLYPIVDLFGMTRWMFGNVNAVFWLGATLLLGLCFFCGHLVASVPYIGLAGPLLLAAVGLFIVGAYPIQVVRAAMAGAAGPPDWPDYGRDGTGRRDAAGVLLVLFACLLPGLLLWVAVGNGLWALPLLLAGWTVVPSTLLLLATSGSVSSANPLRLRDALLSAGARYLLAAAPGWAVLTLGMWYEGSIRSPFLFALVLPAMIAAALVMGTLARENEKVGRRLLAIASAAEESEEE